MHKIGIALVAGAIVLAQSAVPIAVDGNTITLTGLLGIALMTGKVLQEIKHMKGDITRVLRKVFPEEYKE